MAKCKFILTRGVNKGKECGKWCNIDFCSTHGSKIQKEQAERRKEQTKKIIAELEQQKKLKEKCENIIQEYFKDFFESEYFELLEELECKKENNNVIITPSGQKYKIGLIEFTN